MPIIQYTKSGIRCEPICLHRISEYINIIMIHHDLNAFIDNYNGLTNQYF